MSTIFTDNSQSIGNTPLIKLNHIVGDTKATVLAKNFKMVLFHSDSDS